MLGLLLIAVAIASALLLAASARLPSVVSTLLAAYLALVAETALIVLVLSPFHAVRRGGLAAAELAVLAAAVACWWARGRPGLGLGRARNALGEVLRDPVSAGFLAVVAVVLGYELVLALTVPPNNWDSVTYHLPRVAAWAQDGGVHWIANGPADRLNEFQLGAELELLFLFVATGTGSPFALPQYAAELATLLAVYGASRRLGFGVRASACGAFLLATFSLVALESVTSQNDLVAASFPVVAACLILGGGTLELALAGAAAAVGAGVKLTTLLVWPVLALLVALRGRRAAALAGAGCAAGLVLVGMWGYVLNLVHTGHLLGHGGGRVENTTTPSFPGTLVTALRLVYRTLDLSVLANRTIYALAVLGLAVSAAAVALAWRRGARRTALREAGAGAPLGFPVLVLGAAIAMAFVTRIAHVPVKIASTTGGINRGANEDYSAFGPVGAVAVLGIPLVVVAAALARRRVDPRLLALALSLPVFLLLLSLNSTYNPFLTRFLLVPVALTAPLFALLFRRRAVAASIAVVAAAVVGGTLVHDRTKSLASPLGRPWTLDQAEALQENWQPDAGIADAEYERLVPPRACVGAVLGPDDASYPLWGPKLDRRVLFLAPSDFLTQANASTLFYVVVAAADETGAADELRRAGWRVTPLGAYWVLAASRAPGARTGACH